MSWFKKHAEIAASVMTLLGLLGGIYSIIVTISGGEIIPWDTVRKRDQAIEASVGMLRMEWANDKNATACRDMNERANRAADELEKHPANNTFVQSVYTDALASIDGIPNCMFRRRRS